MVSRVVFSSEKDDWGTPPEIFNPLNEEFHFDVDVCATEKNAKCDRYITPEVNGLLVDWGHYGTTAWMNPPYGRGVVERWVIKAYAESRLGVTTVCLLPSRTDMDWFHDFVLRHAEIRWIRGRVKFVGAPSGAPFPSLIAIFRPERRIKECTYIDGKDYQLHETVFCRGGEQGGKSCDLLSCSDNGRRYPSRR